MKTTDGRIIIWIGFTVLLAAIGYQQFQLSMVRSRLSGTESVPAIVEAKGKSAIASIDAKALATSQSFLNSLKGELEKTADQFTTTEIGKLTMRMERVDKDLMTRKKELHQITLDRVRALEGLPEQVELDDLDKSYTTLRGANTGRNSESFHTNKGPIIFYKHQFSWANIPSTGRLAFFKIGRSASTENIELIRAWIEEASDAKLKMGYEVKSSDTKPSEYGDYSEVMMERKDMYFKTYLQRERVQGTYNSTSMQYTYYIEIGSINRRNRFLIEQYNNKLGS